MNNNAPIFIVGAPRSGTTLLQYMLRSHPRISIPTGESHFIVPLYQKRESFGDLGKKENIRRVLEYMYTRKAEFLDTDLHGMQFDIDVLTNEFHLQNCDTIPKIVSALFEKNAKGEGKARWGDKTPYYVLHMPVLLAMFPDAQIIHIIRDGRDCALSMFERRNDFHVYTAYHAAKYWQQYVTIGREIGQRLGHDVYMEVRYEDLLENPVEMIRQVCSFLGEEYDESVISFKKPKGPGKTPLVQRPVQKSNAGKWQKLMTLRQVRIFEGAVGDTLMQCGYPIVTSAAPLPVAVRAANRAFIYITNWYFDKKWD